MPADSRPTLCRLALSCHAGGVLCLLGGAAGSAVTAFGRLGVGRTCRLVATALCAALVSERTTTFSAKTATRLTRRAFAMIGKTAVRTLERSIELATQSAMRRCRTIRPSCGGILTCAGKAATLAAVARIAFAPLNAAEAALAAIRTFGMWRTFKVTGTETPRPIITRRAGKAFRALRAITKTATLAAPAVRAFVFYAWQTAVARRIEARRVFTVTRRGTITPIKAIGAVVGEAATAAIIGLARTIRRRAIKRTLTPEASAAGATSTAPAITTSAASRCVTTIAAATALATAEATTKTTVATTASIAAATTAKATTITTR